MLCLTASIASYVILISFVIPICFGHAIDDDQYIDDSIMLVMLSCLSKIVILMRYYTIAIILENIEIGESCEK